jgi:hypothetical protein
MLIEFATCSRKRKSLLGLRVNRPRRESNFPWRRFTHQSQAETCRRRPLNLDKRAQNRQGELAFE